jgi:hypothetical protein
MQLKTSSIRGDARSLNAASRARSAQSAGAIRCKARRHRWHLRQPWQCGICNLQNPKETSESESHSLRQNLPFRLKNLQTIHVFPVQRSVAAALVAHRKPARRLQKTPIFYREFFS